MLTKLSKLDQEAKETFNKIPDEKKLIVTSEGCFKYFSKAYGVPSAYIMGNQYRRRRHTRPNQNACGKTTSNKVPALFVESSVDERPYENSI
ncbi:MAG: metal ABC transporter solute-binding protein, Zn/Mn family [Streptococcus salivarius]